MSTSLVSISWGAVCTSNLFHKKLYTVFDHISEMIWNILAISCRVITLTLFASQFKYVFGAVVVGQLLFWLIMIFYAERKNINSTEFPVIVKMGQTIGYTFNLLQISGDENSPILRYPWYLFYWMVTMIQNAIMILIWFNATADMNLWYGSLAVHYVLIAYPVSLLVKTFHTIIRRPMCTKCSCCKEPSHVSSDQDSRCIQQLFAKGCCNKQTDCKCITCLNATDKNRKQTDSRFVTHFRVGETNCTCIFCRAENEIYRCESLQSFTLKSGPP